MATDNPHDVLAALLAVRGDALLRTAVLLAPGRAAGEDLLQEALERLLRKWHKVDGDPEAYLRRIMRNCAIDVWRTRGRRPELLGLPEEAAVADHASGLDLRLALIAAALLAVVVGHPPRHHDRNRCRLPAPRVLSAHQQQL